MPRPTRPKVPADSYMAHVVRTGVLEAVLQSAISIEDFVGLFNLVFSACSRAIRGDINLQGMIAGHELGHIDFIRGACYVSIVHALVSDVLPSRVPQWARKAEEIRFDLERAENRELISRFRGSADAVSEWTRIWRSSQRRWESARTGYIRLSPLRIGRLVAAAAILGSPSHKRVLACMLSSDWHPTKPVDRVATRECIADFLALARSRTLKHASQLFASHRPALARAARFYAGIPIRGKDRSGLRFPYGGSSDTAKEEFNARCFESGGIISTARRLLQSKTHCDRRLSINEYIIASHFIRDAWTVRAATS